MIETPDRGRAGADPSASRRAERLYWQASKRIHRIQLPSWVWRASRWRAATIAAFPLRAASAARDRPDTTRRPSPLVARLPEVMAHRGEAVPTEPAAATRRGTAERAAPSTVPRTHGRHDRARHPQARAPKLRRRPTPLRRKAATLRAPTPRNAAVSSAAYPRKVNHDEVLVTGGAGYVGSISVEAFLAAGHDVEILDDLSTGHRAAVPMGRGFTAGATAMAPPVELMLTAEAIEAILHCGARSLVGESIADPARYFRENVAGGIALLEATRAAGVDGSSSRRPRPVRHPDASPIREDAPSGRSTRTARRSAVRGCARSYGRAYGLRSVTLRYFNVAGATDGSARTTTPRRT